MRIRFVNQRRRFGARSGRPVNPRRPVPPRGSQSEFKFVLGDRREHRRYALAQTLLYVTWLDANGDLRTENHARPIDICEKGMAIELPEAALVLSRVRLESNRGKLIGHGKIRYCRPKGAKYIVGIEFVDALRWRAPESLIAEPIPLTAPPSGEELTREEEATQHMLQGSKSEMRPGETSPQSGIYRCSQCGLCIGMRAGEQFPSCPSKCQHTAWVPEEDTQSAPIEETWAPCDPATAAGTVT